MRGLWSTGVCGRGNRGGWEVGASGPEEGVGTWHRVEAGFGGVHKVLCLQEGFLESLPSSLPAPTSQPPAWSSGCGWEKYRQNLGSNLFLLLASWVALGKLFASRNLNGITFL